MEIDQVFGLPAHPLFVHLPVVLVPIAGLMAVAFAIRPKWLDRFGWWLVVVTGVGALGAILAAGSGEALEESVRETELVEQHAEAGETAEFIAIAFFVVVLAIVAFRWWSRRKAASGGTEIAHAGALAVVTSVLLVVSGGGAAFAIADAGHQGAQATWEGEGDESGTDEGEQGPDGAVQVDREDDDD